VVFAPAYEVLFYKPTPYFHLQKLSNSKNRLKGKPKGKRISAADDAKSLEKLLFIMIQAYSPD